mmetsp:Transcript_21562/g.47980  ORF Transcript_21562/g.47980 Transcript_21562/m.47980 type:complete len:601 (+) Transcript_21562:157-1959(+)|eukprot:CAMPEP_0173198466 /NCGR_PEP_ID=MMETSP1141-20130122/16701_1 /TAXON_ID=483371 /ORGANISM="non described non described, Strain CCMP2298" /LENGTH=600 /DNA_ID=CAMNT_0014123259 /DNA_START=159 /DNA_END=1961 /DNA_ORIENTATION=+
MPASKRSFLNYVFFWGIVVFHIYLAVNKHVSVDAKSALPMPADSKSGSGCPLRMARSLLSSLSTNSMLVGSHTRSLKSSIKSNVVDFRAGQSVLGYLREQQMLSRYRSVSLQATTESSSTTSTATPIPPLDQLTVLVASEVVDALDLDVVKKKKDKKKRTGGEALEVVVMGLSHHNAKVEVREVLAIPEDQWNAASTALCEYESISEATVLSTCNRFEMYVAGKNQYEVMRDAITFLHERAGGALDVTTLRKNLFMLSGEDAIWHMLRVSAGLDSLVVGEGQILAQVKRCYEHSIDSTGQGGKVVSRLLNTAVSAGKRVRSETGISKGAVSISSAAAEFTATKVQEDCGVPSMAEAKITIIGAGKMARLLLIHLQTQGVHTVAVINRSKERVLELQAEFPELTITAHLMDEMWEVLRDSDIVFPSTASTTTIIDPEPLTKALALGRDRPGGIQFVDISVPRNVHPDCDKVPGVHCYNVDDLKAVVQRNTAKRRREMLEAELILREEQDKFRLWQQSLGAIPTIAKLQEKAECLRREEMSKAANKLSSLSDKDLETVEKVTKGIVAKLLHGPMHHLRQQKEGDATRAAILQVQKAFQLEEQ